VTILKFLGSRPGRVVRAGAGIAMIAIGLALGGGWVALAVVGIVPLAAGVFDFCLLAPLVRVPFAARHSGHVAARREGDSAVGVPRPAS